MAYKYDVKIPVSLDLGAVRRGGADLNRFLNDLDRGLITRQRRMSAEQLRSVQRANREIVRDNERAARESARTFERELGQSFWAKLGRSASAGFKGAFKLGAGAAGAGGGLLSGIASVAGGNILSSAVMGAAGAAKDQISDLIARGFDFNELKELLLLGYEMKLGTKEAALNFFNQISNFAAKDSPLNIAQAQAQANRLLSLNFSPNEVITMLRAAGDTVAGLGKVGAEAEEKIESITKGLADIRLKGRVNAEEMSRQLVEAGVDAWGFVADALIVQYPERFAKMAREQVKAEAQKLSERGDLVAESVVTAIVQGMMKSPTAGLGRRIATETAAGKRGQIEDRLQVLSGVGTGPVFDRYNRALGGTLELLESGGAERLAAQFAGATNQFLQGVEGLIGLMGGQMPSGDALDVTTGVSKRVIDLQKGIVVGGLKAVGADGAAGYAEGFYEGEKMVIDAAAGMARKAIKATAEAQKSNSPSLLFMELGRFAAQGYMLGFVQAMQSEGGSLTFGFLQGAKSKGTLDRIEQAIREAAERFGVDPELIRAVIKKESSFNPKAKSPMGAMGLMQLMPGTAERFGVTNPYNIEQNVMGGTKYLAELIKEFKDLRLALAAYNAGEGAVRANLPNRPDVNSYIGGSGRRWTVSEAAAQRAQGIPRNGQTPEYVEDVMRFYARFQTGGARPSSTNAPVPVQIVGPPDFSGFPGTPFSKVQFPKDEPLRLSAADESRLAALREELRVYREVLRDGAGTAPPIDRMMTKRRINELERDISAFMPELSRAPSIGSAGRLAGPGNQRAFMEWLYDYQKGFRSDKRTTVLDQSDYQHQVKLMADHLQVSRTFVTLAQEHVARLIDASEKIAAKGAADVGSAPGGMTPEKMRHTLLHWPEIQKTAREVEQSVGTLAAEVVPRALASVELMASEVGEAYGTIGPLIKESTKDVEEFSKTLAGMFGGALQSTLRGDWRGALSGLRDDFLSWTVGLFQDWAQSRIFKALSGDGSGGASGGGFSLGSLWGGVKKLFGFGGRAGATPPFMPSGGAAYNAGNLLSSSGALGGSLASLFSDSITAPATTAEMAREAVAGKAMQNAAHSSAHALGGLGSSFGFGATQFNALAPMLGMQGGGMLVSALAGPQAGGLAGMLGMAGGGLLGIGLTGAPAALSGSFLAPMFSNPVTAIIGGALLVGGIIAGRNAQRRADERTRADLSHSFGTNVWNLIYEAGRGQMTTAEAESRWKELEDDYRRNANALKDSKARRHALLQLQNDFMPLRTMLLNRTRANDAAVKVRERLGAPAFKSGGGVWSKLGHDGGALSAFTGSRFHGLVPGVFDGKDDKWIRVTGREVVLRPEVWGPIAPYLKAQDVPGFAEGGAVTPVRDLPRVGVDTSAAARAALSGLTFNLTVNNSPTGLTDAVLEVWDEHGSRLVAQAIEVKGPGRRAVKKAGIAGVRGAMSVNEL